MMQNNEIIQGKEIMEGNGEIKNMEGTGRILRTRNLSIGFREKKKSPGVIFENINVSAGEGELVALFGVNGVGKSTLLRSLVKLLSPLSGEIFLFGLNINSLHGSELARKVGFVSTETIHVNNLKVLDLVSLGRYPYTNWMGRLDRQDKEKVDDAIEMVGIKGLRHKYLNQISDGERQKAMIARTLAQDTRIIVLDEPTAFLDLPNKYEVIHLLHNLARQRKKTIVYSTHDLNIAIQETDKIWLMLSGSVYQGAPEDLILGGTFGKMFEHTSLLFNTGKGEFRIQRELRENIGLRGSGPELRWTRNALERMGFRADVQAGQDIIIDITRNKGRITWKLVADHEQKLFNRIYDLCSYLARYCFP